MIKRIDLTFRIEEHPQFLMGTQFTLYEDGEISVEIWDIASPWQGTPSQITSTGWLNKEHVDELREWLNE